MENYLEKNIIIMTSYGRLDFNKEYQFYCLKYKIISEIDRFRYV